MSTKRYILISVLKILVVIALAIILFFIGAMIGFGVIGEGQPREVFNKEMWAHIFEFFEK